MARKKMIWQLIMPFIIIIVSSLVIITWFSFKNLRTFYLEETKKNLYSKLVLFEPLIKESLINDSVKSERIQELVNQLGLSSQTRITLMLPSGIVIADSKEIPDSMDNHASRHEMSEALNGNISSSIRYSNTLQISMMYLAMPIKHNEKIIGVLRFSVSTASIDKALNRLLLKIAFSVILVAVLASLFAVLISRKVSRPLEELKLGAEQIASGNFSFRLPIPNSEEIARLAEAMNSMAKELDKRIRIITRQKNEQQAILQSMIEGVIAIDTSEKIINLNSAASRLFNMKPEDAKNKNMQEVIRNITLQKIISKTLAEHNNFEGEITLYTDKELFIGYSCTVLKGAQGDIIGALVVLNDMTHIRYLENIRRDFVANVSHELKTPITSIKGFVETLTDGGTENQEDSKRFLQIISKQVDRLNNIIEDLLSLSRIEQDSEKGDITFEKVNIFSIIESSIEICDHKAKTKNIQLKLSGNESIEADINIPLFEQAIINLLDNAIKYSSQNSKVYIELSKISETFKVTVSDEGIGIESRHLDRLFERFYRIDKARSRELGGTGLGLAIVKHIVLALGGVVSVESEVGQGSKFTIEIPLSR